MKRIFRPKEYWRDFENIKKEVEEVVKKLGRFPLRKELLEMKKSTLVYWIVKYHGGLMRVGEKMGYNLKRKSREYWGNFENVRKELEEVIKKLGRFPLQRELIEMRRRNLLYWIVKYYGGLREVCKKMGCKSKRELSEEYWKNFENVKKELEEIIKELGRFPKYKELERTGKGSIVYWIKKYHGGVTKVCERMGYKLNEKPKGYWKDINNVKKELEEVIEKLGRIPTYRELIKMGKSSLCSQVSRYHGKLYEIYKKMGYEVRKKPGEYWRNFENIKKAFEEIIKKLGKFPSRRELVEMRKSNLSYWSVKYHGGLAEVRKKMGYQ
jgi:exonuclease VII small subunit